MAEYNDKIYEINLADNYQSAHHTDVESNTGTLNMFNDILNIPNWNVESFIKERLKFRTQMMNGSEVSAFAEPGTYFYKLFFNFNTAFGLLGSIVLNENGKVYDDQNNAWQYLTNNMESDRFSQSYKNMLYSKRNNLTKFVKLLNYITNECPWFFKNVENLNEAVAIDLNTIAKSENRSISLSFNQDALDMRVSTLFDLYRDACFDFNYQREIIPENLRKFDMCILIFNPPIEGMNMSMVTDMTNNNIITSYLESTGYTKDTFPKVDNYKISIDSTNAIYGKFTTDVKYNNEYYNNLSFRGIILKNCEFDINSLSNMPQTLSNESGFKSEISVKINFERSYIMNMNNELSIKTIEGFVGSTVVS